MHIFRRKLGKDALKELRLDKMESNARLEDPSDRYYRRPIEFALHVSEFYECSRCHNPFFGGYMDC